MEGDREVRHLKRISRAEVASWWVTQTQVAPTSKKPQPPAQCVPSLLIFWRGPTRRQLHGLSSPGSERSSWTRPAASWTAEYRGDECTPGLFPPYFLCRAFLRETVIMLPPACFPPETAERGKPSVFRKSKSSAGLILPWAQERPRKSQVSLMRGWDQDTRS